MVAVCQGLCVERRSRHGDGLREDFRIRLGESRLEAVGKPLCEHLKKRLACVPRGVRMRVPGREKQLFQDAGRPRLSFKAVAQNLVRNGAAG